MSFRVEHVIFNEVRFRLVVMVAEPGLLSCHSKMIKFVDNLNNLRVFL